MSFWPSKDPDAYVRGAALAGSPETRSQPPYLVFVSLASAGAGLIVLAAAVVGALSPSGWFWILFGGMWVSRSQVERWWQYTHADRAVSWLPASVVAVAALSIGFAATLFADGRADRSKVLYVALVVAWFGGDVFDWLLRRRRARQTAA